MNFIPNAILMATNSATSFVDTVDFTGITDMANSVAGKSAPVVVSVLAIVIGFKLIKKFGNKIG